MIRAARPSRELRVALLAVLILLTAASVTMTTTLRHATTLASMANRTHHEVVPVAVSTTTRPDVATSRPLQAGGGCGFSLGGSASISPVGHCTVLEIGDSLGNDLGWGLARELPARSEIDFVQLDKSATGLANSSFYDWPSELGSELRAYEPQLVLVCLGGNDEQAMEIDGSAVQFSTQAWQEEYLTRARRLVSEVTSNGAFVLWVGMPVMQQPSYSQGMKVLNSLYQQAVNTDPNATFLSTWALFSNPQGDFQANAVVNRAPTALRQPDGIHFSLVGENVIATYVIDEIASTYHVRVAPTAPAVINGW